MQVVNVGSGPNCQARTENTNLICIIVHLTSFLLVWIRQLCYAEIVDRFNCLVESKTVKQEELNVILKAFLWKFVKGTWSHCSKSLLILRASIGELDWR